MDLKIHVICLALNEEVFIINFLEALYPFVDGISILTQYDRDYYGNLITPDSTIDKILSFPDPKGKIHLIMRKFKDETVARNHEMNALIFNNNKNIISHGVDKDEILKFHGTPDYFLIADADEIYDSETFPRILNYLGHKKPRGMRITGFNYYGTWNKRVPVSYEHFKQFGFIKAGLNFKMRRQISFNEGRLKKLFKKVKVPDISGNIFGFLDCPIEIGVFHHGWFLGNETRHKQKLAKHSHKTEVNVDNFLNNLKSIPTDYIPTNQLPQNIINGSWPENFFST